MKRKIIVILLMIQIFILSLDLSVLAAKDMTDIRVGLVADYRSKASISIKNTRLGMGYCINNSYRREMLFHSNNGFVFTVADGVYYILDLEYPSYEEARQVALKLSQFGTRAYPVSVYRGKWTVQVGIGLTQAQAAEEIGKLGNRFGFQYKGPIKSNGHRIKVSGSEGVFLIDGSVYSAYPQWKAIDANRAGAYVLDLGERKYRGRIEVGSYGTSSLTAVNIVNLEAYLYGVVPAEMVSAWPAEALKAQAVCSRSYALLRAVYGADSNIKKGYGMVDTTTDQVYKGYGAEQASTTQAVNATRGETVRYEGKTITAFYYSTSGGRTENGEDVWGLRAPYYRSVADLFETEPEKKPWMIRMTKAELNARLSEKGFKNGIIREITPEIWTESGRVYSLKIKLNSGNVILQAEAVRTVLGLPSTMFKIVRYGETKDHASIQSASGKTSKKISDCYILSANQNSPKKETGLEQFVAAGSGRLSNYPVNPPGQKDEIIFAGMGYGHGIGLSQSGAKGMAKQGFNYREIISYYFTGAKVG